MSRLMSVALTEDAVRSRTKTVTRRKGWLFLKPGDTLTLCRKVMGRKGEPLVRLAEVRVVDVRRERLGWVSVEDVAREGFPGWTVSRFLEFAEEKLGLGPFAEVTRIEWVYLPDARRRLRMRRVARWPFWEFRSHWSGGAGGWRSPRRWSGS